MTFGLGHQRARRCKLRTAMREGGAVGARMLDILELDEICQPLWTFPWLRNYDAAMELFSRSRYMGWPQSTGVDDGTEQRFKVDLGAALP